MKGRQIFVHTKLVDEMVEILYCMYEPKKNRKQNINMIANADLIDISSRRDKLSQKYQEFTAEPLLTLRSKTFEN